MKKIYLFALALAISFVSCENEELSNGTDSLETTTETDLTTVQDVADEETELEVEDFELIQSQFLAEIDGLDAEALDGINLEAIDFQNSNGEVVNKGRYGYRPRLTNLCLVKDADRCPFEDRQPTSNMWWPENDTDYFNPSTYYSSTRRNKMLFATFSNGTALIRGITSMNEGKCKVYVNVWLKDKQTYDEFSANGGEFKLEPGCASQEANPGDLSYYEIDNARSWLYSWGSDCVGKGCFGLEQRGENLRGQLGANGAAFDSNIGALGFSNWGWITDRHTGERLWVMDFDFRLRCCKKWH